MKRAVLFLLVVVMIGSAAGQSLPDSLWTRANRAMGAGDFTAAAAAYEDILRQGYEHEELYYNLGNAYYRLGERGEAIWAYEKGLQFAPKHTDLKYNRDVVRTQIKDRIDVPEGFILLALYRALKNFLTRRDLLLIGALLLTAAGAGFALRKLFFTTNRPLSVVTGILLALSLAVHLVFVDKATELSDKQEGVIVTAVAEAHSTPSSLGKTLFKVHEGLKVEITQVQDDWLEIILLDGKKGWVYAGEVRML